jgi:hypothetical protein
VSEDRAPFIFEHDEPSPAKVGPGRPTTVHENTSSESDAYIREVRNNHYLHWAAMIAVTAYMWQLQGWLAAIGVFFGLLVAISVTNIVVLSTFGSLKAVRWSRWGWVIVAFVIIMATNAEIGGVQ